MGAQADATDLTALAATFQRDGACVVRGLLEPGELTRLEQAVERNLAEPSERAIEGGGDAGSGRFFEDFRNWTRIPGYEQVIRGSRLGEVAAALTGSRTVRLHHDHLLVKEPGTTIRTPWHQDQPYYNIDGFQTVSFWIPLDPVPRESTLEFVSGSHASRTWYMPRSFFDDRALVFEEGTFDEVPDVESDRDAFTILGWALEPGDAVAFNMLTLHAAAGSRNRRRAFSVRLVGDDVRLAARPHKTSPPFPELDGVLAHGDRLEHPLFPRLWPRDARRSTRATIYGMARVITQRELRNSSGDVMRALDRGEAFVVTRNGVPVGELTPLRTRKFVAADTALAAFAGAGAIAADRFRADIDAALDHDPTPRG